MTYLDIKLQGVDAGSNEKEYSLKDFKGQTVVLYFYPKDNTSGCTQEACDFRDNYNKLTSKATVIGVSPDSIESHKGFQEKHGLNFILLSDPERKLAETFDVVNRSTFILDKTGKIQKEWRNVKVDGHIDEVLESI